MEAIQPQESALWGGTLSKMIFAKGNISGDNKVDVFA